jgi:hypothetical protein
MSEQVTEVVDAEVVSDNSSSAIERSAQSAISAEKLRDLGIMVPIADPIQLRAAFDQKQRLYAAILDPSDYLYTVSYMENGRTRQFVSQYREHAEKVAGTYSVPVIATPKKSGIVKLARALGIVARRVGTRGLPEDANATFSYVTYEATHEASGTVEQGIGWCDMSERGGKISKHDVIATADTRAYNRAVLRLSGFGEVSADEVIGGSMDELPTFVPEPPSQKLEPIPAEDDVNVVAAMSAWAKAIADGGNTYAPAARQAVLQTRVLRARARRGDQKAAHQLGASGLAWEGRAQDSANAEAFEVGRSSVDPKQFLTQPAPDTGASLEKALREEVAATPKPGLDLTGKGPEFNDVDPPWEEKVESVSPDPNADTITTAQAKKLSLALVEMAGGNKDKAREWLAKRAHVGRAVEVRSNQYEKLMLMIEKQKEAMSG